MSRAGPCLCERLWDSMLVLRESGQRYGMSERDIERFITHVLETNEPREHPSAFPRIRAPAKCAVALVLVLVLALVLVLVPVLVLSQSPSSESLVWSCPLEATRLLQLPIAHKHQLQGFRFGGLFVSSGNSRVSLAAPDVLKGRGVGSRLRRPPLELTCRPRDDVCSTNERPPGPNATDPPPQSPRCL